MILKSLTRKAGMSQLFTYLFANEKKLKDHERKALLIKHNVRSRTLENYVKEFKQNESLRLHKRIDNVLLFHTILSFSNKDKELINEKVLRDIAKKYIELRGENSMYLGAAHYDRNHIHLHLVMSGTEYLTGKSNRISQKTFHELKLALDKYQREKYPELVNSLPSHGRSKNLQEDKSRTSLQIRIGRESEKQALVSALEQAYSQSKSLEHFLSHLQSQGHEPYYRAGRLTGVKFDNERKFRFSRLGYTKERLAELDHKSKEEKALAELQTLRERNAPERERGTKERERDVEDDVNR